jgi:hypothetical protein
MGAEPALPPRPLSKPDRSVSRESIRGMVQSPRQNDPEYLMQGGDISAHVKNQRKWLQWDNL